MRLWTGVLAGLLLAQPACAHTVMAGSGVFELFLGGAILPFETPYLLMATLSLSLFIGCRDAVGFPKVFGFMTTGTLAGMVLPILVPGEPVLLLCAVAFVLAALSVLALPLADWIARLLALLTGGLIAFGCVAGHGFANLPWSTLVGVFAAIIFSVSVISEAFVVILKKWPHGITRIGTRVVASWIAAITILLAAFTFV
jgi:hypothetical protein